ncbi:MAG: hypothetical protein ACI36Y_01450 [Coriobacteriales bacterium]
MIAKVYRVWVFKAPSMEETGAFWSLQPWGCDTEHYSGDDDGGHLYELPDGVHVGEDLNGLKGIFLDEAGDWGFGLPIENTLLDGDDTPYLPGIGVFTPLHEG